MSVVTSFALILAVARLSLAAPAPAKNSSAAAMQTSLQKQRDSLQKQRESLRHQPNATQGFKQEPIPASTEFIAPIPPLVEADCPPVPDDEVEGLISSAAQKQSLDPALIRAVMRQESGFRPCAVSVKGAQGLMQLMPATAAQFRVEDPFDPRQNVDAGAALLKQLLDRYKGDLRLALVAYNAGANRADDPDSQSYPVETQRYVASILADLGVTPMEGPSEDTDSQDEVPAKPVPSSPPHHP